MLGWGKALPGRWRRCSLPVSTPQPYPDSCSLLPAHPLALLTPVDLKMPQSFLPTLGAWLLYGVADFKQCTQCRSLQDQGFPAGLAGLLPLHSNKILPVPSTHPRPLKAPPTLLLYKHNREMLLKARCACRDSQTLQGG